MVSSYTLSKQVKRCSLAGSQQQNTPNQNSHCFSVVFSRHHAIAILPFGVASQVCHVCCFGHGLASRQPTSLFKATSFSSLHFTRCAGFHFASFISVASHNAGCPLFSSPALSFGLRSMGAYFLLPHNPH